MALANCYLLYFLASDNWLKRSLYSSLIRVSFVFSCFTASSSFYPGSPISFSCLSLSKLKFRLVQKSSPSLSILKVTISRLRSWVIGTTISKKAFLRYSCHSGIFWLLPSPRIYVFSLYSRRTLLRWSPWMHFLKYALQSTPLYSFPSTY